MKSLASKFYGAVRAAALSSRASDRVLINQGRILAKMNASQQFDDLADSEFSVFSQWGEDGIIQYLVGKMPNVPRTFIEFGVEDFKESNCRFLMMKDNWSGFIIDGSSKNVRDIQESSWYWQHDLTAVDRFITRDNISEILAYSRFDRDIGILSVDIDGVDYHVLEALGEWRPHLVIVEYNGLWGCNRAVTVPYDAEFQRLKKHYSGLYWGANLKAFDDMLQARGYFLAGTNSVGSNAFFVRDEYRDLIGQADIRRACRPVSFRDTRDQSGRLLFLTQGQRNDLIADMPLIDVELATTIRVGDLGLGSGL